MSSDSTPRTAADIEADYQRFLHPIPEPRTSTGQAMLRGMKGAERDAWALDILAIEAEAASPAASGDALREALLEVIALLDDRFGEDAPDEFYAWHQRATAALAASPPLPEGLDVERLATALNLVTYGEPAGKPGPAAIQEAEAIIAEYARLASREGAE